MTTHSKTVILKDTNLSNGPIAPIVPRPGINVAYKLIDKSNGECYATFFGSDQSRKESQIVYSEMINDELSNLNKRLLSDRARNAVKPKLNIVNSIQETIR